MPPAKRRAPWDAVDGNTEEDGVNTEEDDAVNTEEDEAGLASFDLDGAVAAAVASGKIGPYIVTDYSRPHSLGGVLTRPTYRLWKLRYRSMSVDYTFQRYSGRILSNYRRSH